MPPVVVSNLVVTCDINIASPECSLLGILVVPVGTGQMPVAMLRLSARIRIVAAQGGPVRLSRSRARRGGSGGGDPEAPPGGLHAKILKTPHQSAQQQNSDRVGLMWPYRDGLGEPFDGDGDGSVAINDGPGNGVVSHDGQEISGIVARSSVRRYIPETGLPHPDSSDPIAFYSATIETDDQNERDILVALTPSPACDNLALMADGRVEPLEVLPSWLIVRVPISGPSNQSASLITEMKPRAPVASNR